MEPYDRKSDEEIHQLVTRVAQLEGEVKLLRIDFEDHCVLDETTHEKMLTGIAEIRNEQTLTKENLIKHTTNEEIWQNNFKLSLEKIGVALDEIKSEVAQTRPIVKTYNDFGAFGRISKAIVDIVKWLVPMIVGIGASYMYFMKG